MRGDARGTDEAIHVDGVPGSVRLHLWRCSVDTLRPITAAGQSVVRQATCASVMIAAAAVCTLTIIGLLGVHPTRQDGRHSTLDRGCAAPSGRRDRYLGRSQCQLRVGPRSGVEPLDMPCKVHPGSTCQISGERCIRWRFGVDERAAGRCACTYEHTKRSNM